MDSLTQIVLGAAVGEAVLGKKAGNKAQLYGAIAGTIPDLDVMASHFTDTITATEIHRGFSHSVFFAILISPFLGLLINKIERKLHLGWQSWAWLFFWGIFTHPLLDAFTTWGTQLFWPLESRLAFNSIFVIDPFYTLPFLICTIWAMRKRGGSLSRKRINLTGIIISSFYLLSTLIVKYAASQQFEGALKAQNIEYKAISTRPSPFNIILWNANIDAGDGYLLADYSFFDSQPISFRKYKKQEKSPPLTNDKSRENLQRLKDITQGWYLMEEKGDKWYFYDLRFGTMPLPDGKEQFVFTYELFYDEDDVLQAREMDKTPSDGKFLLTNLWERIQGN